LLFVAARNSWNTFFLTYTFGNAKHTLNHHQVLFEPVLGNSLPLTKNWTS
jgi:hypothetical protein